MQPPPIQPARIHALNSHRIQKGRYVLYWMQQSQRAEYNHALEYAIQQANALGQGVLVGFGLMDDYPEANLRHYNFMLEGLQETQAALAKQGIKMVVQKGFPAEIASALGADASLIVCDRGYLRHQKAWRAQVARSAACTVVQVESDVVVPVALVSSKAEYAARTIRPRIHRHLEDYIVPFSPSKVKKNSLNLSIDSLDLKDIDGLLHSLSLDRSVTAVTQFYKGGSSQGMARFEDFIQNRFHRYVKNRNQPQTDDTAHMSPYLHFGQISPLYLSLRVKADRGRHGKAQEAYLEELIIRRELAMNFTHYNPDYHSFACLPPWARNSLLQHRKDHRENIYTRSQLENARTHDVYWNAAMEEMKITGFMHNYMRMYWGKKILEWTRTPEHAFRTALAINNTYFLDGRDPSSHAGVAWIFGMHDRAWFERSIFGKVRYMAASGLERKCDIQGYVHKVASLAARS